MKGGMTMGAFKEDSENSYIRDLEHAATLESHKIILIQQGLGKMIAEMSEKKQQSPLDNSELIKKLKSLLELAE
jgi:hypothetical protein